MVVSVTAFNQTYPKLILLDEDSCIVFTLEQSKTMAVWDIKYEECRETLDIAEAESATKDSIINNQSSQIVEYVKIDSTYQLIDQENVELRAILEEERQILKKDIRKQKRQKWLIGIGGFLTTAFTTYLYIQK